MRRIISILFIFILFGISKAYAVIDPLTVPNNRIGVHILDPEEIIPAAKLVNSSGGDWGYVTIPIRSNDRDREKWTKFFTQARLQHVIPIIRLATYPIGNVWIEPTAFDLVDFANFLEDMPWPTQNRYIILFNEPNHHFEWGGAVDPRSYATLLLDARRIFKSRSADFYLLSAGLDMSAPNSATSQDALEFYRRMTLYQPDWYQAVDGISVHSYPNPAFSSSPYSSTRYGISSYKFEINYLSRLGFTPKPIFMTETGWINQPGNYSIALKQAWNDPQIIAVTPFLLFAGAGDFKRFSLVGTPGYEDLSNLPKISGSPLLSNIAISAPPVAPPGFLDLFKKFFQPRLTVGNATLNVEIADTNLKRSRGLSGRKSLATDAGMLFVFSTKAKSRFWMQGMLFDLDFIWIRNKRVIQLDRYIVHPQPDQNPAIIVPQENVDQVLEVPAGFIDKYGIKIGDKVERGW